MTVMLTVIIGVLGLCSIFLASPYDIPTHVPDALMLLSEHSHDPDLIQVGSLNLLLPEYIDIFLFRNQ
jgi:hypothetical protein